MKPTTILSTALFALTASASWLGNNEQKALDDKDDKAVPGKNPLAYCAKPDDYLLSIDNVDLDPNPPQAYVFPTAPASMSTASAPPPSFSRKPHTARSSLPSLTETPANTYPHSGKSLNITATGLLSERVEKGAKAHLSVKYGLIKILTQEVDLCEQSKEVDEECPIQKGDLTLSKKVELPVEIPPVCFLFPCLGLFCSVLFCCVSCGDLCRAAGVGVLLMSLCSSRGITTSTPSSSRCLYRRSR